MKSNALYKGVLVLVVVLPFLATIYAMWTLWNRAVFLSDIIMLLVFYTCVTFGVTVGFHRMLTHRSFQANPVIKFLLLVFGSMSLQGPAIEWAATHVKHHAQADKEGDPHSPVEGFVHSHFGWLFKDRMADPNVYCRNLVNDRMVMFVSRTFLLWVALSLLIPFAIGGWHGLLWAGLVRIFIVHHVTWSVNSICHTFGMREFETTDKSRNEWVVGLLAFGEGWHNNHHAFPRSAFHGLHWWQVDFSAYLIRGMERLGLAKDVYRIPPDMLARRYSTDTTTIASTVAEKVTLSK
ncbi:stearoyl-CoA 9-desaturase [Dictyobacter vulcani]|uniref:Stearoyl-CoA 9-desaturase n=1 Tax=Dictyobacter vulcani TaxID=2607529 RepID=A0A5J4KIK9_9CHLR|nr:acyl-CoA desaturase [Dictyobacter vulcani]GER86039.1 stearoyl-CoA 9-desaturase [Dictyobacter vulcani]